MLVALAVLGGMALPVWAQMAVRVDNATKELTDPPATNFWPANPVPLHAMTNALTDWPGNTNVATAAQGAKADTALQPGTSHTNISGLGTAATNNTEDFTPAAHAGDTNNPHAVTKAQVGLGSADDTSDMDKPVSTAQQTALDGKAATNDARFPTADEKAALAGTSGDPAATNKFVTDADARLTNARTPTAHDHPLAEITDAGSAAGADVGDFATAAQGAKADTAMQSTGSTSNSGTTTLNVLTATTGTVGTLNVTGTSTLNVATATTANITTGTVGTLNVTGTSTHSGNSVFGSASGNSATFNAGTVIAANATDTSDNRLSNVGALTSLFGRSVFAKKTSTTSRTETTTKTNDPDLVLPLTAGSWIIDSSLFFNAASATPGWDVEIKYSGTYVTSQSGLGWLLSGWTSPNGVSSQAVSASSRAGGQATFPRTLLTAAGTNQSVYIQLSGMLTVTTSGTLAISWSQTVSSTDASSLQSGSYMRAVKIP